MATKMSKAEVIERAAAALVFEVQSHDETDYKDAVFEKAQDISEQLDVSVWAAVGMIGDKLHSFLQMTK